jgi:MFS transporter, VNT family, synaptic vesicle glycoprotein 2
VRLSTEMDVKKMEISVKIENEEKSVKTFEEILKEIGFGCVQIEIAFVVNLVLFTVLNETMGISFILPAAECDLNLDSKSKGILSSMTFIGIMISSLFWGYYADTQGRRLAMLHALTYASIFTTLSLFVQDLTLFAICRFMTGIL